MTARRQASLRSFRRVVGTAIAAIAIVGAATACDHSNPPPTATGLASYAITYRLIENGVRHWEVVAMHRPFRGSDLVYDTHGPPRRDDPAASGTISSATVLYAVDGDEIRAVSGRQPGPASGDLYLSADLDQLVARKLASATGERHQIAGRQCRVYRFAEPPSGPLAPLGHSADHADLCLDASGLVLLSTWTYHGRVVLDRRAVAVRTGTEIPAAPSIAHTAPAHAGAATAIADARATTFLAKPPTPDHYRDAGSPVVFRAPDPNAPTALLASSVVWAFSHDAGFITVEAGQSRDGQLPWRPHDTVTRGVVLRGLGRASSALRSDGVEVRVDLGRGRWVRVRGSTTVEALTSYAQRLHLRAR